jgi:hypothetical protein
MSHDDSTRNDERRIRSVTNASTRSLAFPKHAAAVCGKGGLRKSTPPGVSETTRLP